MPATQLRVQSSIQGVARTIGWGLNRYAGNLVWYGAFTATPESSGGGGIFGKGGGSGSGKGQASSYDYTASAMIALGEGTIAGINTIYNGSSISFLVPPSAALLAIYESLGVVPYDGDQWSGTYFDGTYSQTPWSYLSSLFPSQALGYRGEVLACYANLALGSSPSLPNFNYEVLWGINSAIPSIGPDANFADILQDFIGNPDYGVPGFPAVLLGDLTTYRTFCAAAGLLASPVLDSQQAASSVLEDWMTATASEFRWSSGQLVPVPMVDAGVSGNGYNYVGPAAPAYSFNANHFLPNQGSLGRGSSSAKTSVAVARTNPIDVVNQVKLEYLSRANLYNPVTIYATNDAALQQVGGKLHQSDLRSHHFFCLDPAALTSVWLQLSREQVIATYQFTVGPQFILIDVLDEVWITEPRIGLSKLQVRVVEIQENADRSLTITAEEVLGTVVPRNYAVQTPGGAARNSNAEADPVNAPLIWEPPPGPLTSGAMEVWTGASGGSAGIADPNWGGCVVWVSLDNVNYSKFTTIDSPLRQGTLTGLFSWSTSSYPDTVDTCNVNMTESGGVLPNATPVDAAQFSTLCLVDDELVSYTTSTLTATNNYALTGTYRALYGTPGNFHLAGAPFARLDSAVEQVPLSTNYVGTPLWLKFQSFNQMGLGLQPLSDCVAYPYTPFGSSWFGPVSNNLAQKISMDLGLTSEAVSMTDFFGIIGDPYTTNIDLGAL